MTPGGRPDWLVRWRVTYTDGRTLDVVARTARAAREVARRNHFGAARGSLVLKSLRPLRGRTKPLRGRTKNQEPNSKS